MEELINDKTVAYDRTIAADRTVLTPQDENDDKTVVVPNDDKTVVVPNDDKTVVVPDDDKTMVADKTVAYERPDDEPDLAEDATFRTIRTKNMQSQQEEEDVDDDESGEGFILKGERYKLVRSLSENSGEAQVFLVRRHGVEKVLKVYYPNYDVNRKLMQIIRGFRFEMLVRVDDYGKTYVDGKNRFYELMEYLSGGSLKEYHLGGDQNTFRRIALQAAAALSYCHKNDILHKDIKPSNFFFRDKTHSELVLGDFGISSLLENGGKTARTTQARTPIYAAPEMYTDVIDGEVEVTPAADYYSLGITLFYLWLGENPFSTNERAMMRAKSEGRLPRLDELPTRVKMIIQGLTAVNPQSRWKYEEVERWFLGENVNVDQSSPFLRYKSFIVDPDRNLVADNLQQLVPMLVENRQLAVNYLYNGRITSWLEASGNMKLATMLKDLLTNRYPVDQNAGFTAAIYALDPSYPYHDVQGEACEDMHSIALSLLSYKERYAMELQNANHSLFLWLEAHTKLDVNRLRSYFTSVAEPHVAIMRMVYEIDPEVPFMASQAAATLPEIAKAFGYGTPSEDDWHSLVDGRLLSWMHSHEDVMACESLRIMTHDQVYSPSLAHKVLYNLDRTTAYDLREARTPDAVGTCISNQLKELQHATQEELAAAMQDVINPDGRFYYYAQLHDWQQYIAEANRCFDMESDENRQRLSAYDLHTALYRFCRILGAEPVYQLPNGKELKSQDDLYDPQLANVIRQELRNGSLAEWLSIFYHEDPDRDFAEEYSYERALEQWLQALGSLDAQNTFYKRLEKAREETNERMSEVRREWNSARLKETIWQDTFYVFTAAWLVLLLVVGIDNHQYVLDNPYHTIVVPLGTMTTFIVFARLFFSGVGPFLAFLLGALSSCTALAPYYLLKFVEGWNSSYFIPAIVAITLIYAIICHLTAFRHNDKSGAKAIREILNSDDINTSLLEPLYYTFKTKSFRYKSSKFGILDDISNQVRSTSGENVMHYVLWSITILLFIIELVVFSPKMLGVKNPFIEEEQPTEQPAEETVNNIELL